uniref:C2 domain-containing protein n=1 Tax=Kalanchoe fedtschenkoi TaxID=63787 RepID=A0A7N0V484_KALFE
MATGILEVHLVDAKGLKNTDSLGKSDPYVVVKYGGHERKSSVARGAGKAPKWNERLTFKAEYPGSSGHGHHKLTLRIMDKDFFSSDDFVGETSIYVEDLLAMGVENGSPAEMHPQRYRVVLADKSYCGQIQVGVTFTPKKEEVVGEDIGGWKESGF